MTHSNAAPGEPYVRNAFELRRSLSHSGKECMDEASMRFYTSTPGEGERLEDPAL